MTLISIIAFLRAWWRPLLGAALAAPVIFMLGRCDGIATQKARQAAEKQRAELKAANDARAADAALTARRSASDAAIASKRKEVDHANAQIPDGAPSARQRARACLELRRTGRVDANASC